MDLKIVSQKKNVFLDREEIVFDVVAEKTPSRKDVKNKLMALTNTNEGQVLVKKIENAFGSKHSSGSAFIYPSIEKLKGTHRAFALKREGIAVEVKKAAEAEEKK